MLDFLGRGNQVAPSNSVTVDDIEMMTTMRTVTSQPASQRSPNCYYNCNRAVRDLWVAALVNENLQTWRLNPCSTKKSLTAYRRCQLQQTNAEVAVNKLFSD